MKISNNRANRNIKPFEISQENFLSSNTPNGAQGSTVIYSLTEMTKENQLAPYRYLIWIMTTAPVLAKFNPDWAAKLTPSNAPGDIKGKCAGI